MKLVSPTILNSILIQNYVLGARRKQIKLNQTTKEFAIFTQENSADIAQFHDFLKKDYNIFLMRQFILHRPLFEDKNIVVNNKHWKITYKDSLPSNKTKQISFEKNDIRLDILFTSWKK